jgi:hypothetical protein
MAEPIPVRITRITIKNMMRLTSVDVELPLHQSLVTVGGQNEQGKSAFLMGIENCFVKGKPSEVPIHEGATKGSERVELSDDDGNLVYIIEKKFRQGGAIDLTVTDAQTGEDIPDASKWLDSLTAKGFGFDPVSFAKMGKTAAGQREQLDILKRLLNLDFTALDAKRKTLEADRTEVGRDLKFAKENAAGIVKKSGVPTEDVKVADLMAQLQAAQDANRANTGTRQQYAEIGRQYTVLKSRVADLKTQLAAAVVEESELMAQGKAFKAFVNDLKDVDEAPLMRQIAEADTINAEIRTQRRRREMDAEVVKQQATWDKLTGEITAIDEQKRKAVTEADYPVEGLAFDEDTVLYKGRPLSVASTAEGLQVATAIGIKRNPQLKVILIREGSSLDDKHKTIIAEMAAAAKVQVFAEVVCTEGATLMIEDGVIAAPGGADASS